MFKQTYHKVGTVNNFEDKSKKSIWDYIFSWWGALGGLASMVCWYELHERLGWWFFWM
jgi:hypothetical protein